MANNLRATVFIPTYNAQPYLAEILDALLVQEVPYTYEVLIIDSGSSDNTLEIIKVYQNKDTRIHLHEIPNEEFGHGKTRNLAAKLAKGTYIVYLSHDAVPAHKHWLYEMLKPFEISPDIKGVTGKQIPRRLCVPMLKYEINGVFHNLGPDFGTTIFYEDAFIADQATFDAVRFYSDVNSATIRDFLLKKLPYRDVLYAEDQLFGEDLIKQGYKKAYAPRGNVIHSNDIRLKDYRRRIFDETYGLRKTGVQINPISYGYFVKIISKGILADAIRILRDGEYSLKRKLYWLVINPLFHIEKWRGYRTATSVHLDDKSTANKHSLESKNRSHK